jgi:hypothetical protein
MMLELASLARSVESRCVRLQAACIPDQYREHILEVTRGLKRPSQQRTSPGGFAVYGPSFNYAHNEFRR